MGEPTRAEWPPGPWDQEADEEHWMQTVDGDTAYACSILRHPSLGQLCGYVGVPLGHRLYGIDRDDPLLDGIEVHGGLTYNGNAPGDVPDPECNWWFGFDTAHCFDIVPSLQALVSNMPMLAALDDAGFNCTYRDMKYVREQTQWLAVQLHEYTKRLNTAALDEVQRELEKYDG